eukprot:gene1644-12769_t
MLKTTTFRKFLKTTPSLYYKQYSSFSSITEDEIIYLMKSVQKTLYSSTNLFESVRKLNTEREFRLKYRKTIEILIMIQQKILTNFIGEENDENIQQFNLQLKKYLNQNEIMLKEYRQFFKIIIEIGFEIKDIEYIGNKKMRELSLIWIKELESETGKQRLKMIKNEEKDFEKRVLAFQDYLFGLQMNALSKFNLDTSQGWLRLMTSYQYFMNTYEDKEYITMLLNSQKSTLEQLK